MEQNGVKFGSQGWVFSVYWVLLTVTWLRSFWVIRRCISDFGQSFIWKTACRRAKRSEIWASGVTIQCIQGTFDSTVLKVILGHLMHSNFQ